MDATGWSDYLGVGLLVVATAALFVMIYFSTRRISDEQEPESGEAQRKNIVDQFVREAGDHVITEVGLAGASVEDILGTLDASDEAVEIVGDYGGVLETLSQEGYWFVFPLSRLPYPKSVIRNALHEVRRTTPEGLPVTDSIDVGLESLDRFVPDEDIPESLFTEEGIEKAREAIRKEKDRDEPC